MFGRSKKNIEQEAEARTGLRLVSSQADAPASLPAPVTPGLRLGAVGINAIYLRVYAGILVVEAHDEPDIVIDALDYEPRASQIDVRIRGEELHLSVKSSFNARRPWQAVLPVRVGLRLKVPRMTNLRGWTTSGSIRVHGIEGDVVLETERGRIDLDAPCRSLAILTESGDVDLRGLVGPMSFKSASGWLSASWMRAPAAGLIEIKKAKGVTELALPADTRLGLRFTLGPIAILNEFVSDAAAPLALHVTSRTGNLSIRKNLEKIPEG